MENQIKKFEVHVDRSNFERDVRIWLHRTVMVGGIEARQLIAPLSPITVVPDDDGLMHNATLELDHHTARSLMDALWAAGFRPNNGEGMDAQVTAIKAHLEDMRTLVFKNKPAQWVEKSRT